MDAILVISFLNFRAFYLVLVYYFIYLLLLLPSFYLILLYLWIIFLFVQISINDYHRKLFTDVISQAGCVKCLLSIVLSI